LLIIIGLHLYFNWRVVVHFFWSKLHNSFNLKREFVVASAIIVLVFVGTLWNIPPFSSVMDLGRDAKLSWEGNGDVTPVRGGRWSQAAHKDENSLTSQRVGGGGRWADAQTYLTKDDTYGSESRKGRGKNNLQYSEQSLNRGQGKGRMSNPYNAPRPESRSNIGSKSSATLKGRDYVRLGKIEIVMGSLVQRGDEWELKAGDVYYAIHMGPSDYRNAKGLVLTDGADAVVTGFVYGSDLSVTMIETGSQSIMLRDEIGRPAWAGTRYSKGESRRVF
jgi:hypothetical protein